MNPLTARFKPAQPAPTLRDKLDHAEQELYAAERAQDLAVEVAVITPPGDREFILGRVHANVHAAAAHLVAAAVRYYRDGE